ncbi:uncharacterized protein isoform X1 [Leptinotarsa decemlineata]|uniref:uncharacterized protein isoform X1 n=1 Tax=Leptinotarsa decemlineata TaxID=7539 RepID=UPI003D30D1DC
MATNSTKKDSYKEQMLQNALLMTEVGMDLKERYVSGDRYVSHLKTIISGAEKAIATLHSIAKASLEQAQKVISSLSENELLKEECDRVLTIIEKQLADLEFRNLDTNCENFDLPQLSEKIRSLESRQKFSENCLTPNTASSKNVKADVNEKYPENLSRESLIDLNAVVNLPPVPEDIFTSFSSKPTRSSSLSSLKSMRKIKMFLQRAESSDEDDSSDADDQDCSKLVCGDSLDGKSPHSHSPISKNILGNIKEETQD